jgi:hypothetical protein
MSRFENKDPHSLLEEGWNLFQTVSKRSHQIWIIAFWIFTLLVAYENASGAMWTFTHLGYMRAMLAHLGYPPYFSWILQNDCRSADADFVAIFDTADVHALIILA